MCCQDEKELSGWSHWKHSRGSISHILTAKPQGLPASHLQTWEPSSTPSWWLPSQSWPADQSHGQITVSVTVFGHWHQNFYLTQSPRKSLSTTTACGAGERVPGLEKSAPGPATLAAPAAQVVQAQSDLFPGTVTEIYQWNEASILNVCKRTSPQYSH